MKCFKEKDVTVLKKHLAVSIFLVMFIFMTSGQISQTSDPTGNLVFQNSTGDTVLNISETGGLPGFFEQGQCASDEAIKTINPDGSYECNTISTTTEDQGTENLSETLTAGNIANQTIEFRSDEGIRIGDDLTSTSEPQDIAIGKAAEATGFDGALDQNEFALALGQNAGANTRSSISIGTRSNVSGDRGIAIGGGEAGSAGARAIGRDSIAIGTRNADDNLVGEAAKSIGEGSVAIGSSAVAPNDYEATFGNLRGQQLDVNVTGDATIHGSLDFFEGRCSEGVVEQVNLDGTYDCGAPVLEEVLDRGNVAGKGIEFEQGVELGDSETSTGKEWLTSLTSIIYDTARQWRNGGTAEADTDIGGNVSLALQSASQSLDWEASVEEDVNSIIVENGNVVFTTDDRGTFSGGPVVRSVDVADGSQNWEYTGHNQDTFGLAVDGDVAYSGDDDGDVVAYDGSQGTEIFNNRYHDNAVWAADFEDGILYTASWDNTVKAYDVEQEKVLWSHERHNADVYSVKVKDGVVYSGGANGKMIAYDGEEQEVLWTHQEHEGNILQSLAIEDDLLISGANDGKVAAYSIEDRGKLWSHKKHNGTVYGVDIDGGVVVSSSENTTVKAYHAYEEELLWSHNRHSQGVSLYDVGIGGEDVSSGGDASLNGIINVDNSMSFATSGGYNSDILTTRSGDEMWSAELESSLNGQSGTFRLNVSNQSDMSSSVSKTWSLEEGLDEVSADARGEFAQFDIDLDSDGTDTPRVFRTEVTYGNPAQQGRDQIAIGNGANTTEPGAVAIGENATSHNPYEATFGNLRGEELDVNVTGGLTVHQKIFGSPSENVTVGQDLKVEGDVYSTGADLAEIYSSHQKLEEGELVMLSDRKDVERTKDENSDAIGVVSTDPGSVLNADQSGYPIALEGKAPVRVNEKVEQGDHIVPSGTSGVATSCSVDNPTESLTSNSTNAEIVEAVKGMESNQDCLKDSIGTAMESGSGKIEVKLE